MTTLKRKLVALATLLALFVPAIPAVANPVLCVTHFDRQPGPSGYHSHTTGNFVDGTEYKIVQYYKAGPGYIYLAKTVRRFCG